MAFKLCLTHTFEFRAQFPYKRPCLLWPVAQSRNLPRVRWLSASLSEWPNGKRKRRLDELCCELEPQYSRNVIQSFIMAGKVFVNDQKVTKAGYQVKPSETVDIRANVPKYVSRAGVKLERALELFAVDVTGKAILDAGLSTGGFTDCLLQRGAAKIFGVDVGYGQVAERIRTDQRVTVLERTNLRHLTRDDLGGDLVDMATLDLSFISVLKVLPAVLGVLSRSCEVIVLVKPQFEAGPQHVARGGVVRDATVHAAVVQRVVDAFTDAGLVSRGVIESPIRGDKSGNKEFLVHFIRKLPPCFAAQGAQQGLATSESGALCSDA